ncbi:MAG: hypothetical protein NT166_32365 [Candidatus Aminicenantes bacterium]|nr:hypothetical protein [Candidatus Aminicenantes bacterium]
MKQNDIGYLLATAAANMLFLFVALQALSIKKNWKGVRKWAEKGAMFMIVPFALAALVNFLAQQPAWTVIIPLLMLFFLAAEGIFDALMKSSKPYLAPVIFRGLFFVMAGLGMTIYAFAGGTAAGFITLGAMAAAGWAGFLSTGA